MADVERILTNLLRTVVEDEGIKDPEYQIKAISTGGANYTSTLHLVTVKSAGRPNLELFAKVACVGEQLRAVMPADRIYGTERFVYQSLAKTYNRLQERIPEDERLLFPKFYACDSTYLEETVILENLEKKGYRLYDRLKSITWEYGAAAVGELAKFHALSYAFKEDNQQEFEKIAADHAFMFEGAEKEMLKMFQASAMNALNVIDNKNVKGRLEKFLNQHLDADIFTSFYTSTRPVLVHGDYRVSNLLYRRKNGKLDKLIPVDYQTLHSGTVTIDLVYFIFSGTDGEFRRHHYQRLIDHYYNTFATFLGKLGHDANKLYPREDFNQELKEKLPFGLLIGVSLLPIVLVAAENAPTMDGDVLDIFTVKTSDLYKKRLTDLIDNFIKWGVL